MENVSSVYVSGISPVYNQDIEAPKKVYSGKMQLDSFSQNVSGSQFSENLFSQYHKIDLFNGYYTVQGNINNKTASFNQSEEKTGLLSKKNIYKGYFGDKKAEITIENDKITGKVDEKEINLAVKHNIVGKGFSISGNIGDKEINIQSGSEICEAKDENDILTLCMSLNGNAINIKDGKFDSLGLSKEAYEIQQQAMMADLMMQQQAMPM